MLYQKHTPPEQKFQKFLLEDSLSSQKKKDGPDAQTEISNFSHISKIKKKCCTKTYGWQEFIWQNLLLLRAEEIQGTTCTGTRHCSLFAADIWWKARQFEASNHYFGKMSLIWRMNDVYKIYTDCAEGAISTTKCMKSQNYAELDVVQKVSLKFGKRCNRRSGIKSC